jgi:acyl carrier protein
MTTKDDNAALRDKVLDIIAREGAIERSRVTPESTLETLDIKSMDIVMILNGIEEEFDLYIPIDESLSHLVNVGDIVDEVARRLAAKKPAP